MDLIRILNSPAFKQWLAESLAIFFLFGGFVTLAVGLGLFFRSESTLRLFGGMNRWISMRKTTRPLEIARDTRSAVMKHRRWIAGLFILGGLFALYGLFAAYDERSIIFSLRLNFLKPAFAGWAIESTRWVLVAGNLVAIVIGLLLAFRPATVEKLEAAGARWFSERQATKGADDLRLGLDARVAANPRNAGLVMAFFGVVLIGTFAIMLFGK